MSASLVGSEMCIRDSPTPHGSTRGLAEVWGADTPRMASLKGQLIGVPELKRRKEGGSPPEGEDTLTGNMNLEVNLPGLSSQRQVRGAIGCSSGVKHPN
eukprot:8622599-Alexandrium_andersonii.AAC.1